MLSFAANLSMLFTEVEFLERFAAAAKAGFRAVECQFPYAYEIEQIGERLERHRLPLVLHNLPAGNWGSGERGIACLPNRVAEFQDGVGRAIEYTTALGCRQLNCLAGLAPANADHDTLRQTFIDNLRFAAGALRAHGITLLVEPLNTRDTPGFFLRTPGHALAIIDEARTSNLALQFDVYHAHIMEPDLAASLESSLPHIAHLQIADNPGRHEPGSGSIDFASVFDALRRANYRNWIGCEYAPSGRTEDSFGWFSLVDA